MAAQELLGVALEAERQAYLERHAGAVDGEGRRVVVGNGYARAREITTAAGRVAVQAPRVDDRRPGERYISALLPPYMRRSPKVTEVLPLLYLRGLSTGDFLPVLSAFFGSEAGLSASAVGRLTEAWQAEHERWQRRCCPRSRAPPGLSAPPRASDSQLLLVLLGDRAARRNGPRTRSASPAGHRPARAGLPSIRVAPNPGAGGIAPGWKRRAGGET